MTGGHLKDLFLITGASSGIGKALALHFANQGSPVLAGVRSEKDHESIGKASQKIIPVFLDVADSAQVDQIPQLLEKHLAPGQRLVLINNAGVAVSKPWELLTKKELDLQISVNVAGPILVTQKCLPCLRQTQGLVINMSSVSGLFASPFLGPYSLSKFAMEAFTDSLRREMAFFGVKVCSVNPGPIDTPIWDKGLQDPEMQKLQDHPVYGKLLKKFQKGVEKAVGQALGVEAVVEVVDEMVRSDNPRIRVVVAPAATRAVMNLTRILPPSWVDQMVKRF